MIAGVKKFVPEIIPKHMSRSCFLYFHGSQETVNRSVNEIPQPSRSSHRNCAQQFHFGHSHAEAQAGKCFQI